MLAIWIEEGVSVFRIERVVGEEYSMHTDLVDLFLFSTAEIDRELGLRRPQSRRHQPARPLGGNYSRAIFVLYSGSGRPLARPPSEKQMGVPGTRTEARGLKSGSAQEARLIEACQRGDRSAFNLLVWRWEKPLFNFVCRYVGDAAAAQDLVQDTFVRVVRSIGQYSHRGAFSSWLYQVAVNLCKDHLRKKRLHVVSLHDYYTTGSGENVPVKDQVVDEGAQTDAVVEAGERERLVRRLLAGLPDDQRVVILLKEYQALTFAEIAEVLGVPEGTAKARLYRGLRAMRQQLQAEGRWPQDGSGGVA